VFVLGVIAILFGFYQTDAVKAIFLIRVSVCRSPSELSNDLPVVFWGLYVVCTTMSFERWKARKRELQILLALKSLAGLFFDFGATMTLVLVIIDSLGRKPQETFVFFAGIGVLIGILILVKWSRRLRRFTVSMHRE